MTPGLTVTENISTGCGPHIIGSSPLGHIQGRAAAHNSPIHPPFISNRADIMHGNK